MVMVGFDNRGEARGMLAPGGNPYVDFIADCIVDGREFILPEELVSPR